MSNKKAKQMIERLTGAYFATIAVESYWNGYKMKRLVYCLAAKNRPYAF